MAVDGEEDVIFVKLCVHVHTCNLYQFVLSLCFFSESFERDESCTPTIVDLLLVECSHGFASKARGIFCLKGHYLRGF